MNSLDAVLNGREYLRLMVHHGHLIASWFRSFNKLKVQLRSPKPTTIVVVLMADPENEALKIYYLAMAEENEALKIHLAEKNIEIGALEKEEESLHMEYKVLQMEIRMLEDEGTQLSDRLKALQSLRWRRS
ncbi:hypothetical protein DFP72DRAFT_1077363 [Ephemerocybe angulata]|uniref:Uncharacterized protein n=1 Tax=Ephemerocybe angulata TaxID=980116 RepID=A0A8H6HFX3_9AGAR|nr:hypothetical protein DFP72DRAFT_1077363 [Tulosesus angulatus]